ncbi:hypothetical protein, unlikely [Trypanosoma brucei gambiense DAL972]|uniref:Uncharacterized protein n=1 Tax=Trypanosoma brucei gambiense (strain MHOM/CI/86/DAL972) TaxID=679716 RepID=C9ZPH3_TRYB9|nr:hypothetical protein, unlikely [Trypanosoma brucei gambiense DAL972]CBH11301.1 hypothetical protein, unlikely [Trypanosoma brucei gambiense DAL972]|eukprot:XP_011773588.1 hypothetical protein, unlikely [Trypanosoma brucei gambiense DAL972]
MYLPLICTVTVVEKGSGERNHSVPSDFFVAITCNAHTTRTPFLISSLTFPVINGANFPFIYLFICVVIVYSTTTLLVAVEEGEEQFVVLWRHCHICYPLVPGFLANCIRTFIQTVIKTLG